MFEHTLKERPFERHYEDQVASPGLLHMFHSLRLCVHTNLMSWNGVKKERKRKGQSGEKDRNSDVLTYLNVRNYGYAHMKAKAAPFQSRFFDSCDDYHLRGWRTRKGERKKRARARE